MNSIAIAIDFDVQGDAYVATLELILATVIAYIEIAMGITLGVSATNIIGQCEQCMSMCA